MKKNYAAWNVSQSDYPQKGSIEEKIKFILGYGILAPSIHNTQSWKFEINNNVLKVYPNKSLQLKAADPSSRNLYIGLGACVANILIAAGHFNFIPSVSIEDKSSDSAYVSIKFEESKSKNSHDDLFEFIPQRYSNKTAYLSKGVPKILIELLRTYCLTNQINLVLSDDRESIHSLAILQAKATLNLSTNIEFRKELAQWLKPNNTGDGDGMPGFVAGLKPLQAIVGRKVIANSPVGFKILAKKDRQLLESSPLVGAIFSHDNDVNSWINSGQSYEKVMLKVKQLGLEMTPMHALIEDTKTVDGAKNLLGIKNGIPQMFFRIGYSNIRPYHTPRRELDTFLNMDSENKLIKTLDVPIEKHQIEIGNYSINYITAGKGQPLLLLHGGNIGWGQWYPNIAELAKYFKVYALDLPGAGRSSRVNFKNLDPEKDLVEVVEKFIDELELKKVSVIGSSVSGWIGLKLALRDSLINKLIVVDGFGFSNFMAPPDKMIGFYPLAYLLSKTALKPARSNKNLEGFLRSVFYNKNFDFKKEFIDYFYETTETSHNLLFISRLSKIRDKLTLLDKLHQIKNKTLIVWGSDDKLMPVAKNQPNFNLIPNSSVHIIKEAGHIPSVEKSREFNEVVIKFLRE